MKKVIDSNEIRVIMHYIRVGRRYEEIAQIYGVPTSRISQIQKAYLPRLG